MTRTKIYLTEAEWREVYRSLNVFKTKLHSEGRYTDAVDDLLYMVLTAKTKRIKVA